MVNVVLMDHEFDKVEDEVGLVEIDTAAAREHVGEIERMIRGIKEIFQEIVSTLPFNTLPKQFVIHLTYYIYMFLYCMTYS